MKQAPEMYANMLVTLRSGKINRQAFRHFPSFKQEQVILSEIDGVPLKRIAETQAIALSGAKSRVQRGRRKLEETLRDCCTLEFSRDGAVMDFSPKAGGGRPCWNS